MTKDQIEQLRRHRRRVCASQGHVMHLANIFERGGQYLCRESMYREHSNNLGNHAHSVAATVVNAIYIRCSKSGSSPRRKQSLQWRQNRSRRHREACGGQNADGLEPFACYWKLWKNTGTEAVAQLVGFCHHGLGIGTKNLDVQHRSLADHLTNVCKNVVEWALFPGNQRRVGGDA